MKKLSLNQVCLLASDEFFGEPIRPPDPRLVGDAFRFSELSKVNINRLLDFFEDLSDATRSGRVYGEGRSFADGVSKIPWRALCSKDNLRYRLDGVAYLESGGSGGIVDAFDHKVYQMQLRFSAWDVKWWLMRRRVGRWLTGIAK